MFNPVKNNPWYMNIVGVSDYITSDKISIDAINKGEDVTQKELDSAINTAKKITPFGDKNRNVIEHFKELFIKHDNPQEDILYKENKNIPQSEIERASKYAWFEGRDKELNRRISNKVSSWYDEVYGNEKAARDATGRLINLKAKYSLPQK